MSVRALTALAVVVAVMLAASGGIALAVQPDEMLKDPQLESRAREISAELRCLVCQNQSIDDSDAQLARDLRLLVRERLTAGDSNDQVRRFLVDRYGDFVLLRPPLGWRTSALWLAPLLIFLIGLYFVRRSLYGGAMPASPAKLSDEEKRRLNDVLSGGKGA